MFVQFKTLDDLVWQADFEALTWARVSPLNGQTEPEVLESGKLVPQMMGVFSMAGRRPPELCSLGHMFVGKGEVLTVCLRANVEIKDFTMPVPFSAIRYQVISALPQPEIKSMTRTVRLEKE